MVRERQILSGPGFAFAAWMCITLVAVLGAGPGGGCAYAQSGSTRLFDAAEQGVFNVGVAHAAVSRFFDPTAGNEVLKLDYTLPPGTAAGIWAKAFPGGLHPDSVDVVRLGLKEAKPNALRPIAAALEIKGTKGIQKIPLNLQPFWSFSEPMVDWQTIGVLTEVVVSVDRLGQGEPAIGSLFLDVRFERFYFLRTFGTLIGGLLLMSLFAAFLTVGLRWAWNAERRARSAEIFDQGTPSSLQAAPPVTWLNSLRRDFVLGAGTVFTASLVIAVYLIGASSVLEAHWTGLGVAVAGALLAEWWKFGLTGKHLTAGELFRDMFVSGLLAASASPLPILQAPSWTDFLFLSQTGAAVAALVYHAANAIRLALSGKHLDPIGSALIVATPYLVSGLLLLASDRLPQTLGQEITLQTLTLRPVALAFVGRVLVLFCFNAAVANGLAVATKRSVLKSWRAYLSLFAIAVGAIVAPRIADYGSSAIIASYGPLLRLIATILATVLSQAALWAEVYLITGMVLDAIFSKSPTQASVYGHAVGGLQKGIIFSGIYMGIVFGLGTLWEMPAVRGLAVSSPMTVGLLFGALVFPLAKTIIESFDTSPSFFRRLAKSYRNPILSIRGAVVGLSVGYVYSLSLDHTELSNPVFFGFGVGVAAFAGVNVLRDSLAALWGRGRPQSWRVYLVQALLGGFIGAAVGFYFDASQLTKVKQNFFGYFDLAQHPKEYDVRALVSKWGLIKLGRVGGGSGLLFAQALAGVITWSVAAWLFAINRAFMEAYFRKETAPITGLFSPRGMVGLTENMIYVLRWGLWMSPIINSFLRQQGDPTWYNQDGAIRTLIATYHDLTMSPKAFHDWSLNVFVALMAYDAVRILIWLDHMGLRVATLVNLSFLGLDRLEQRLARFLNSAATARCIPEGVKRFTTWAPLLIPFYIPAQGADWDYAWSQSQTIEHSLHGGPLVALAALPPAHKLLFMAVAIIVSTAVFSVIRWLRHRFASPSLRSWSLKNRVYEVTLKENGELFSQARDRGYDVSRRSYDLLDPAGRTLFLVDPLPCGDSSPSIWPVIGNFPEVAGALPEMEANEKALKITNHHLGLRATLEISLPDKSDPVELWTITVEHRSGSARPVWIVPYLEWVLNKPESDRGHTQYNRLFAEMEYVSGLHAILAWDKHSKAMGLLASDLAPEGFLTSRMDFIGRARSIWTPRALETLMFGLAQDTDAHPTFDPIGSLLIGPAIPAQQSFQLRLLMGLVENKQQAIDLITRHLRIPGSEAAWPYRQRKTFHPIGHGEIPPGAPQPYFEFSGDGRRLSVRTQFTPRPYDHTMSNSQGHVMVVTNRGLHTSANVNAQQNRLTPDWSDTVTRELPSEAFYLYDPLEREWFSPTYHPLNDRGATHEVEFGVDGTATYRMVRETLETELTVFVPPEEPAGLYLLTVRNHADVARRIRLAPYFQMVLADQPEHAGPLRIHYDKSLHALFFENPRNVFRTGPAFVALSCPPQRVETHRGRFFGSGRSVAHPYLVKHGEPDTTWTPDNRPIAAFLTTWDIPARGECTVEVILGQTDQRTQAEAVIRRYQDLEGARAVLGATRKWWLALMDTLSVETNNPEFDRYLDWLKYQALAERIWARRGFYQASGAYGFRDQLQDAVNLIWVDPVLARRQILLHASQQFLEGDVVHWFHCLQDGRTGFAGRTHASDNLLWLAWATVEYFLATGDDQLLNEQTPYLESELPFEPLPAGNHGMGFNPLRSARCDTVYRHCLKAIDLVLEKRLGAHGLPLMGTGDWNDGLDEIGSQGKGESIWLGFFLYYILDRMIDMVGSKDGPARQEYYGRRLQELKEALERTWRGDRYLRAIHDDGTEIGVKDCGVWEIDALTAAWAVMAGINPQRGRMVFETALRILEKEKTILLGWPPLREDTKPYLGRSSIYPEGVRENGMYCHGVQWLIGAARILAEQCQRAGALDDARRYRETAYRLWLKIVPHSHVTAGEIETYGGQPNKQAADLVTTFDPGRMIWHGYTGAAGWVFRQALEGVLGMRLVRGEIVPPTDLAPAGELSLVALSRDLTRSPLDGPEQLRPPVQQISSEQLSDPTKLQWAETTRG